MTYSSFPLFWLGCFLPCHFIRSLIHLTVLLGLLVHKFLFHSFVDAEFSIAIYLLCSVVLLIDSLCMFFYKEKQENVFLNLFLALVDALFLSGLVLIMGPLALLFVFLFAFIQSFPLFLSGRLFTPLIFLLYLSIFIPVAFLWLGGIPFEDRLSLVVFFNAFLFFILGFSFVFKLILRGDSKDVLTEDTSGASVRPSSAMEMPLELARKLQPVLNSLLKYFPETKTHPTQVGPMSSQFFPYEKGREHLKQLRNFILNFIEYVEPEMDSFLEKQVDLKEIVERTLDKLEEHPERPEMLNQKVSLADHLEIKGSAVHLEKCFEQILINSFEALKNQSLPKISVRGYLEKLYAVLEFSDNGHGIEKEDVQKVFNLLFSKRFGLRGLGLSYVKKVIKAHDSTIDIYSSSEGTTFVIKFPLIQGSYGRSAFKKPLQKKKVA